MEIQLLTTKHLPQVMDVEIRAYPWPWTEGMFLESLRNGHLCHVGMVGEKVRSYCVAFVAVQECHILNICVDPETQRKGCGKQMSGHSLQAAKDLGAEQAFLEVRPRNSAAIALYENEGFVQVGVRKNYYPAGEQREDAWVYRLEL